MPDVSSIANGPFGALSQPKGAASPADPTEKNGQLRTQSDADRVELSEGAIDRLDDHPETRLDRVEAVRRAIAEGAYETPERLNIAIDRLLQDIDE
ncbi:MAG: flagellar biosynthesis anti-sigma factor FlgM [Planctomycetota bacterium]|jgi:negative regulator of flagellin synthesis FlgM